MTTRNLLVHTRSIYTAIEVVTLRPMLNHQLFESYQQANNWTARFVPNFMVPQPGGGDARPSRFQKALEALFIDSFADWLDFRLMEFWKTTWKKRYSHLTEEKRDTIFHCSRDLSTAYNGDFASKILSSYHQRLALFGLHG